MSLETRWILDCIRSLNAQAALSPPVSSLDWNLLLASAEAEGLAPALGFVLRAGAEGVPARVRERLSRHLTDSVARQLVLSRELAGLLRHFDAAGVPVIPLKGLALGEMLYPDPALRPSSDLDLLIRPETLLRVDGLLRDVGYRRLPDAHSWDFDVAYDRATLYEGPSGVRVDLHWGLLSDPRYSWNEREGLTVWDRAVRIRVAGEKALGLCPEDLLLYLALHLAVHHGLAGLLWYWDLFLVMDRWAGALDWQAVVERASRWQVRAALYFALLGLELFFGPSAPASVMGRVKPRGPRAATVGYLLRHRGAHRRSQLEHLIALLLVDRSRDLLAPVRDVLCPPPDWVRARYEGAGPSLLMQYLAHYRRAGEVASRLLT